MRGRTKLVSLAAIFTVIIVTSAIFASGFVNGSGFSLFSSPVFPDQIALVYVDPSATIKDYVNDPGYQIGDTFQVHVNITDATDLFSYQVNVTWTTAVLNFSGIFAYGDFLARTGSSYGTSRIEPTVAVNRTEGWASIAETILGNVGGITGGGRLFTIQFEILAYGYAYIGVSSGGEMPTILLDSTGAEGVYTAADGYFRNGLIGDANLDRIVDVFDILAIKSRWNRTPASPDWVREYDVNDDAIVDVFDILTVKANWNRVAP